MACGKQLFGFQLTNHDDPAASREPKVLDKKPDLLQVSFAGLIRLDRSAIAGNNTRLSHRAIGLLPNENHVERRLLDFNVVNERAREKLPYDRYTHRAVEVKDRAIGQPFVKFPP